MEAPADRPVYRVRRFRREGNTPGKYRASFEIVDERTAQSLASCDLGGRAVFSRLEITDPEGRAWKMTPNRRVMPSRWAVTDPDGMDGDRPVAKLVWLERDGKPTGIVGKLRSFLTRSDRGVTSAGSNHLPPAPVALAMILLFEELTDTSGG